MSRDVIGVGVADEDTFGAELGAARIEPEAEFGQVHPAVVVADSWPQHRRDIPGLGGPCQTRCGGGNVLL